MRLATWNVNSVIARTPRLVTWLEENEPDVVCLQETKCDAATFPSEPVESLGYEVVTNGDGRWNGVAILSRVGLTDALLAFPGQPGYSAPATSTGEEGDPALFDVTADPVVEARAVGATCGPLRIWALYVPNGRALDSPHYAYKLAWLDALRDAIAAELGEDPFAVCGDFNIAPTDADVWDPAVFVGSTHVSEPERAAYRELVALGLTDVMPRSLKGEPYTYWDYRAGSFHKGMGMRIDLVLGNTAFATAVSDAYVDREARKGTGPSDHAPVVVDVDL
jgi:exodeoxyribonuclease-3